MQRTRAVSKTLGSLKQHILNLLSRRFDVWFKLIQNDEFKKKMLWNFFVSIQV